MSHGLFDPVTLRGLTLPNRVVVAPMCQYSAENGDMNDWHLAHLGQIAVSGPGLLIIEATGVEPAGRITPGCVGLYDEATEAAMTRVVAFCKSVGHGRIGLQLAHAGRKASTQRPWEGGGPLLDETAWPTVAPSAVPHAEGWHTPQALDEAGMERLCEAFADSARRAARMGIDMLEVHAAHGYLLHQFLSPLANRRTDAWGGSLENRMRFPLAVFRAVRAAFPADRPIFVRVSATDWVEGGWDVAQTCAFSEALEAEGCDAIHVSSGGVSPHQQVPVGAGYQVALAAAVKARVGIPVVGVGMITEPMQAETILRSGQADMVGLAREFLRDPHWTWRAAKALGASTSVPPQYVRAQSFGR